MGHILFIFLHIIALLFLGWGLIITIPLHLIYSSSKKNSKAVNKQTEAIEKQTEELKKQREDD